MDRALLLQTLVVLYGPHVLKFLPNGVQSWIFRLRLAFGIGKLKLIFHLICSCLSEEVSEVAVAPDFFPDSLGPKAISCRIILHFSQIIY